MVVEINRVSVLLGLSYFGGLPDIPHCRSGGNYDVNHDPGMVTNTVKCASKVILEIEAGLLWLWRSEYFDRSVAL